MIEDKDLFFNLYSSCKLVKGKTRGTITDIQRSRIELVPNELIDILIEFNGSQLSKVYNNGYSSEELKFIDEYFQFLIDKEIIFLSKEKTSFLEQDETFETPRQIISAIIDIDKKSSYSLSLAIQKIDDIGCDNLQLRLYDYQITPEKLKEILILFNNTSFRYIEILLQYKANYTLEYQEVLKQFNRVFLVYFHSYDSKDKVEEVFGIKYIYTSVQIISSDYCGFITPFYFDISPITYYIGNDYNTCLYKKIAIDVEGNIKNCPSMLSDFGKIETIDLNQVLLSQQFRKYWDITKDKISICKGCEFRKVCTDCRAYLTKDQLYDKPVQCDYDPSQPNW